ncbi:hypothetical protein MTO96_026337 [Rhipicephalus appendiculatus]
MALVNFLVVVSFLATSASGVAHIAGSGDSVECDFTGIDLDTSISKMLAKLPAYDDSRSEYYKTTFAGIELLGIELVNKGDVTISVPWKSCAGREGTIDLNAYITRFTTQLRVHGHRLCDVSFSHEGPLYPLSAEKIKLLAHRTLWIDEFFYHANMAIDKAVA